MDKLKTRIAGARLKVGAWGMRAADELSEVYKENSGGLTVGAMVGALALQVSTMPALASEDDIFGRAESLMNNIYGKIAGITLVTAGCVAAVCLYMMIFSKNQQTVHESIQWLKRIAICACAILLMDVIIRFITSENGLNISVNSSLGDLNGN